MQVRIDCLTKVCSALQTLDQCLVDATLHSLFRIPCRIMTSLYDNSELYESEFHSAGWAAGTAGACSSAASSLLGQIDTYQTLLTVLWRKASALAVMPDCQSDILATLISIMVASARALMMERLDLPPLRKMTPHMLTALSELMVPMQGLTLNLEIAAELFSFLADTLDSTMGTGNGMQSDAVLDSLPTELLGNIILSAISVFSRIFTPFTQCATYILLRLFIFRFNLSRRHIRIAPDHLKRIEDASQSAASKLARLAVIALAASVQSISAWRPEICVLIGVSCHLPLSDFASSASRSRDAALINSIHTLSRKLPESAERCGFLIHTLLCPPELTSGEAAALHSGAYSCILRANRTLQQRMRILRTVTAPATTVAGRAAASAAVSAATSTLYLNIEHTNLSQIVAHVLQLHLQDPNMRTPGLKKLVGEMRMTGSLLEEFARGVPVVIGPNNIEMHIFSLFVSIELGHVNGSSSSSSGDSDHITNSPLIRNSIARTGHKLLLTTPLQYDDLTRSVAHSMLRILDKNVEAAIAKVPQAQQMYFLVGISLQVLLGQMPHVPCWMTVARKLMRLTTRCIIPSIDQHSPHPWVITGPISLLSQDTHLVQGCKYLGCTNLSGVMDAALETQLCSGCKRARYCSVDCQRGDWAGHRQVCGKGMWALPPVISAAAVAATSACAT